MVIVLILETSIYLMYQCIMYLEILQDVVLSIDILVFIVVVGVNKYLLFTLT